MELGKMFKMTKKTRLFLWLHEKFHDLAQWFITHCDYEDADWNQVREGLIADTEVQWKKVEEVSVSDE